MAQLTLKARKNLSMGEKGSCADVYIALDVVPL